jgi:hypothetical protein
MMEQCARFMKQHPRNGIMGKMPGPAKEMFERMVKDTEAEDELSKYATSELRALFEDWLIHLEEEIIAFALEREKTRPEDVAEAFKISKESANFILVRLAQKNNIHIDGISILKEDSNGSNG